MRLVRWALSSPAYMWLRAALGVGLSGFFGVVTVACGGGGGGPSTSREAQTDENATEPAGSDSTHPSSDDGTKEPAQEEPGSSETSLASASPTCAPIGSRVVLKLGMTRDNRSVDCYDVDRVQVFFAPSKLAKVTVMGPMSDGFCAIDVEVPKGAESGAIRVEVGKDTFATDSFPVPCPGN